MQAMGGAAWAAGEGGGGTRTCGCVEVLVLGPSVGEVRSQTDWDLVWTRPNSAVLVPVWDFVRATLRRGHSYTKMLRDWGEPNRCDTLTQW